MFIASIYIIVICHLVCRTFEAHAFKTASASDSETTIWLYDWCLAIWALFPTILLHIGFKGFLGLVIAD